VEFSVEIPQERTLTVGHVPDGVQALANLMRPLLVAAALLTKGLRKSLGRLFESTSRAVLRFRLRQQIQCNDQEGIDGVVG
jgi:hypothetical protein